MHLVQKGEGVGTSRELDRTSYMLGGFKNMANTAVGEVVQANEMIDIIDLGIITDIEWHGTVSAKGMVEKGETDRAAIERAVGSINDYYVPVTLGAKTRCIDGRHDPEFDEKMLGAQVPGGAPGAALAYRLGVDKDDLTRGTFLADAETMVGNFLRLGFAPGGHRDSASDGELKVGCGAIDGMDKILSAMTSPDLVDDHKRIVKQLLGEDFDRDTYLRVMGAATVLNGRSEGYFQNRKEIISVLETKASGSVAVLEGHHKEVIVVVNTVPGTTLSSNRFAESNGGIQAFGYDLWRSKQMAKKLLPRPDQAIDRQRFIMARVMTTVATLMALTDGTQRLILRVPSESSVE